MRKVYAGKGERKKESKAKEVKTMDKKEKVLKVINPTTICGDGSCGCGCGVPMETEDDKPQEETQEVHSSSDEEPKEITENPTR